VGTHQVKLSLPFGLIDRVRASLVLVPHRGAAVVVHLIVPLIGIAFLGFALYDGRHVGVVVWLVFIVCVLFTPLMVVMAVLITYLTSKAAREPFTYAFDDDGVHISAASYEYTHRWRAISEAKQFGGFLLLFFDVGNAHCIPMDAIRKAGVLDPLVELLRRHCGKVKVHG
jgi:hypothetical protein